MDIDRSGPEPQPFAVGRVAFALGFAGLLPQAAAVALLLAGFPDSGFFVALAYSALILSFLGGMWWGFAMQRREGQAGLVALAVLPSLVALAILPLAMVRSGLGLIAMGAAILLTLPIDRSLVTRGVAPTNWMRLRVPLSVGLGGLTIVAGLLVP